METQEQYTDENVKIFQMYHNYYNDLTIQTKFNDFMGSNFLTDKDIYKIQNEQASCAATPPATITLQAQQLFVKQYINEKTPFRGLLLWHGLGSGKTCASISIASTFSDNEITLIAPSSLTENFKNDYKRCGTISGNFKIINKKGIGSKGTNVIPTSVNAPDTKQFNTITSNGIIPQHEPGALRSRFENNLIIIDESQLLIASITRALIAQKQTSDKLRKTEAKIQSAYGENSIGQDESKEQITEIEQRCKMQLRLDDQNRKFNQQQNKSIIKFYDDIRSVETCKIVCLSGTPIVNDKVELAVLFNIIHGDIVSWNITCTTDYQQIIDILLTNEIIKNNIDNDNIKIIDRQHIIIHKIPYKFKNKYDDSNTSIGIIHSPDNLCTYKIFDDELNTMLFDHNEYGATIIKTTKPLFELNDISEADFEQQFSPPIFKQKITGLSSYFGNIAALLPRVKITTDDSIISDMIRRNDNLYKYGIGYDNSNNALYEIKYVNRSPNATAILNYMKDTNNTTTECIKQIRAIAHIDQFVYPGLITHLSQYAYVKSTFKSKNVKVSSILKMDERNQMKNIESNKLPFLGQLSQTQTSTQKMGKCIVNQQMKEIEIPTTPIEIHPYTPDELNMFYMNDCNTDSSTWNKHSDSLPIEQEYGKVLYSDQCQNLISVVKNIINKPIFDTSNIGHLLQVDNQLKTYSPKMFEIVKSIIDNSSSIHIIYSEYWGVNILLTRVLQANGFTEFNDTSMQSEAKRYMFFTGLESETASQNSIESADSHLIRKMIDKPESKSRDNRHELLGKFNEEINNTGKIAQVIIINSAAAEGITIKNVRFVHLLHLPPDLSKLFQIIGRAIRNCTHQTLEFDNKTVTPILYLSVNNEKEFEYRIDTNKKNIHFLNMVKQSTIDCPLTNTIDSRHTCASDQTTTTDIVGDWTGFTILSAVESQPPAETFYNDDDGYTTDETHESSQSYDTYTLEKNDQLDSDSIDSDSIRVSTKRKDNPNSDTIQLPSQPITKRLRLRLGGSNKKLNRLTLKTKKHRMKNITKQRTKHSGVRNKRFKRYSRRKHYSVKKARHRGKTRKHKKAKAK